MTASDENHARSMDLPTAFDMFRRIAREAINAERPAAPQPLSEESQKNPGEVDMAAFESQNEKYDILEEAAIAGLMILETLVTDIHRAAVALETIAAQERILP